MIPRKFLYYVFWRDQRWCLPSVKSALVQRPRRLGEISCIHNCHNEIEECILLTTPNGLCMLTRTTSGSLEPSPRRVQGTQFCARATEPARRTLMQEPFQRLQLFRVSGWVDFEKRTRKHSTEYDPLYPLKLLFGQIPIWFTCLHFWTSRTHHLWGVNALC